MKHLEKIETMTNIEEIEVLAQGSRHWALEEMLNGHKVRRACWRAEDERRGQDSFLAIKDGVVFGYPNMQLFIENEGFGGRTPEEFIREADPEADDWEIALEN